MSTEAQFFSALSRILTPIKNRILLLAGKAILAAVKDDGIFQALQLTALADEDKGQIPRFGEFGFASRPPAGTEAIILALGADRANMVVIATEHRDYRFKLNADGEAALYTSDGSSVYLKLGGQVIVKAATMLTVDVPNSEFKGNVSMTGNLTVAGTSGLVGKVTAGADVVAGGNILATGVVGGASFTGPSGSGNMVASGSISAGGNVSGGGTSLQDIKAKFNAHTHPENGTGGGVTSPTTQPL